MAGYSPNLKSGGKNPFRMPLILSRENEEVWLDGALKANEVREMFKPFESDKMDAYRVSREFMRMGARDERVRERVA